MTGVSEFGEAKRISSILNVVNLSNEMALYEQRFQS